MEKQREKAILIEEERKKYISFCLNELGSRLWAAVEAKVLRYGGVSLVIGARGGRRYNCQRT